MPRARPASFADVREIGLTLPEVVAGTYYGTPALKRRGQMIACIASHKSAEPNTLVVRMGFDQRDAMLAEDPSTFYLTDHYVGYPSILVRLERIKPDALRDLLLAAWRTVAREPPRRPARLRR